MKKESTNKEEILKAMSALEQSIKPSDQSVENFKEERLSKWENLLQETEKAINKARKQE